MNRCSGRHQGSALTGGTWSWRLASVPLVVVAVVVTAIGTCMAVMAPEPNRPVARGAPPTAWPRPPPPPVAPRTVVAPPASAETTEVYPGSPPLTEGPRYRYESRIFDGRVLLFDVPEGLRLNVEGELGSGSERPGLTLSVRTEEGLSWICLSVWFAVECGRDVAPGADGIAKLFDKLVESLRLERQSP